VVFECPCLFDPSQRRWYYPFEGPAALGKPVKVMELGPMQVKRHDVFEGQKALKG